jgi:hypothetical protein
MYIISPNVYQGKTMTPAGFQGKTIHKATPITRFPLVESTLVTYIFIKEPRRGA